ncbi:hypothetical protein BDP27DRAFT_1397880 [Rhodocollybia butyracea]|uniref:Structure-specific endonuclease subunit SLX4 n=1 Tax=Rhodocollybia butyracea TaxID=206335 RepID=A0A9P5Q7U0_9AGAR|nr:hypothetical protein BDP27DRAFT_1397880 [Rhodocollybia butyracea]
MSLSRRILNEEIVEDSEPEREAARAKSVVNSILEISDDSLVEEKENSVIDISDSSLELQPTRNRNYVDLGNYDSELDNTLPELRLRSLAKYAHVESRPAGPSVSRIASSVAVQSTLNVNSATSKPRLSKKPAAKPATKPAATNLIQTLTDEFPGDLLSRLLICVCCDSAWTARKSIPQKLNHIKSCAKKRGIKDVTLVELVRKGIENSPALPLKGKSKAPAAQDSAPTTFFAEVVHDAAPKKRGRRQEVASTIKGVEETRDAIMQKARKVVARGDSHVRAVREFNVQRGASDSDPLDLPFSTPRFGKSSLAGQFRAPSMFHDNGEISELSSAVSDPLLPASSPLYDSQRLSSPPATSPPSDDPRVLLDIDAHNLTTPSKGEAVCLFTALNAKQTDNSQITLKFNSRSPRSRVIYISSSPSEASRTSEAANSPPLTPSPRKAPSSTFFSRQSPSPEEAIYLSELEMGEYADNAYLHYNPDGNLIDKQFSYPVHPKLFSAHPIPRKSKSRPRSRSGSRSPSTNKTLRKKNKAAIGGKPKKAAILDENWAIELKNKIIQDTALHLRILRFEPIPLDTFLSLVKKDAGEPSAKEKIHLKEFLDKQAIHFYDSDNVGRRKR